MISELDPVPMTSVSASLTSPDILLHVLHHLFVVNDYPSILSCALVNRAFNACSKTYLYRHVAFIGGGGRRRALKFRRIPSRQSNLRIDAERHLRSSLLPENAPYVKHLYVSELAFPQVYEAIQTFPSLRSLSLSPEVSDDVKTFLSLLANSPQVTNDTLSVLEVWEACFAEPEYGLPSAIGGIHSIAEEDEASEVQDTVQRDKSSAELLMDIAPTSLESLIIHNPKTILLSNLSTWINKLGTLKRISLIDNAGPVTPTMLSSLVSTLSAVRIQELALGLSYSLTDTNLFMALNQLQELKELTVTYYLQLNVPAVTPSLAHLRALRIIHTGPPISTVREANFFSKFVRRIIRNSHFLEELELRRERYDRRTGLCLSSAHPLWSQASFRSYRDPSPSLTSLFAHLATSRHALKVLKIIDFVIKARDLTRLCEATTSGIEHLEVGAGKSSIKLLPQLVAPLSKLKHLRVRVIGVRRTRLNMLLEQHGRNLELPHDAQVSIQNLVQQLPSELSWLGINDREWEIAWMPPPAEALAMENEGCRPCRVVTEMQRSDVVWE